MGEGETTDEFTTQMTIDNIPDEDCTCYQLKTDDALEGKNLVIEEDSKVPQEK